jgi:hypothetical protein
LEIASAGLEDAVRRVFDPTGRPRLAPVLVAAAVTLRVVVRFALAARLRGAVVLVALFRVVDLRALRLRAGRFGAGAPADSVI